MKKIIKICVISAALMVPFVSSANQEKDLENQQKPIYGGEIQDGPIVVYGLMTCYFDDGSTGCECIIVQDLDDCSLQTECSQANQLSNYYQKLHEIFSPDEIQQRAINHVRITEPVLLDALKRDGFPIK